MKDVDARHCIDAQCPFYTRCSNKDGLYSVHCHGLVDDGGIIVWFRHQTDRETQFNAFCADQYRHCEIFEAIMKAGFADD